jgi:endogenous inhibitor of DNA gyrase (YacG/DUF329 family)
MGEPSDDAGKEAEVLPLRPVRPCPICGKPSVREFYPFDTDRCADIDLNRWLSGNYAIPGEKAQSTPGDASPPEDDADRG